MAQTATIFFTTADGEDATQFDTHNIAELLELFHLFLIENNMKLKNVYHVELGKDTYEYD